MMNKVDVENEKKMLLQNIKELELAENRKDIQGILDLITDDFMIVYRGARVEGKAETREWLKESTKNFISSRHVPLRVEVSISGDIAWLIATETNWRKRDEGVVETEQFYMLTFKKSDSNWKQSAVCIA
jgi:ketosteroid isomerase-like protein